MLENLKGGKYNLPFLSFGRGPGKGKGIWRKVKIPNHYQLYWLKPRCTSLEADISFTRPVP